MGGDHPSEAKERYQQCVQYYTYGLDFDEARNLMIIESQGVLRKRVDRYQCEQTAQQS